MFQARVLQVFIASPGDLGPARKQVIDDLALWNRKHARRELVVFVPLAWEFAAARQAGPGEAGGGQAEINRQQLRDADVVIGMFKHRLGQPTTDHVPGTAEEIALGGANGAHVGVLLDRQDDEPTNDTDVMEERVRLKKYLEEELYPKGLVQAFTSQPELSEHVDAILWDACTKTKTAAPTAPSVTLTAHATVELAQALSAAEAIPSVAATQSESGHAQHRLETENWSVGLQGVVDFDYRDYDGDYFFGEPGRTFRTGWSEDGDDSIYAYGDRDETIVGVALVERFGERMRNGENYSDLPADELRSLNYMSRRRRALVDDMLVFLRPDGEILTVLIEVATRRSATTSPRLRARYQIARIDGHLPLGARRQL